MEEFIKSEVDRFLQSDWVERFQLFRANHGRYPSNCEEKNQASAEWRIAVSSEFRKRFFDI